MKKQKGKTIEKYLNLVREPIKLSNTRVMVIAAVVSGLGIVSKVLKKRLEGIGNHWKN